eukprot:CAMPEP_0179109154 /NCGR_PEP_ID=MMETSP0796-20121207/50883_1 /TAXON_ID=73915 /ORGANISM="Pyrodinium bahamense, Strain pbaha01" /LENGTH=35 /DNA_ID= /DNA_START= /DNA_END= /DNA_ORIENTATION=
MTAAAAQPAASGRGCSGAAAGDSPPTSISMQPTPA